MSIQIEFTGYLINELIYRIIADINDDDAESLSEEIEQKAQGKLAIHKEFESCIFEYETDLKTIINNETFRTLELSVQFHFKLNFINDEEYKAEIRDVLIDKIRKKFAGDMLVFIKFQIKEIVRQLTSIDSFPSINISDDILFVIEN